MSPTEYAVWTDLAIWSAVVFVLLATLLVRYAGPPVSAAMRQREAVVIHSLRQAELARTEAQALRRKQEEERVRAREQAQLFVAVAESDAARTRVQLVGHAREEAERLRRRAHREIELAKRKALDELWRTTAELCARLAERLVQTQLTAEDHRRLVEQAMHEIGRQAGAAA